MQKKKEEENPNEGKKKINVIYHFFTFLTSILQ